MSRSTSDRAQYNAAQELENLERVFKLLDRKGDGKLDDAELLEHLKFLGFPATKSTVATVGDMIWEVDEDRDGCVSWEEFRTMFQRVRADKSGWEPKKLFNLVEFMMHDKDASGTIDREECMEILFRRFGRDLLEEKVDEFMQNDEDGDNTITFTEFLHMDQRNDTQKSKKGHFKYSRGLVETTLEEDRRLLAQVNAMLAAKDEKAAGGGGGEKYGATSMREIMGGA